MHTDTAGNPQIIAFTGLPGTGKSTLAERLAREAATPAFAGDWLMGAIKPHGVFREMDRHTYLSLYYGLLETLVSRQLQLGQSAITDCLIDDRIAERWRRMAAEHSAELRVVECVCGDTKLHRSRVEGRTRGIPGWHEIEWDHVERMRDEYPPLTVERIVVDAANPIDSNLKRIHGFLNS
ncbi:AAA family ATPase [Glycomyces salinus]|uniref:AAA family ATPase n=1 Tax=Glycomyces salinus TaxID=980294 RepID=UPI0018EB1E9B|nr:AAA family ATPase [Glycomyces salinus]